MKKVFSFAILLACSFPLWGQRVVETKTVSVNYSATPPTVTFEVYWNSAPNPAQQHLDSVWVFVDYAPISGTVTGAWQPATITAATVTSPGTASYPVPLPYRGLYVKGNPSGTFSATVTAALTGDLNGTKFNWCAYATDYPPNTEEQDGYYKLKGTEPFVVNGGTLSATSASYTGCITSLTDATGCPGLIPIPPSVSAFTASASTHCMGDSVTLTATAVDAYLYSLDTGRTWQAGNSFRVSPDFTTTYTVYVKNRAGCTATLTAGVPAIEITVLPLPSATFTTAPTVACAGDSITVVASGGGSYCFTESCAACIRNPYATGNDSPGAADCDVLDTQCSYTPSGSYTLAVPASGSVTVWVRVKNDYTCVDSISTTIRVIDCQANPTGCEPSTLTINPGDVGFSSMATYTLNGLIMSSPVTVTHCAKNTYSGTTTDGLFKADCRQWTNSSIHLFSWCMINQYGSQLCSDGWRVPTKADYCKIAGHESTCETGGHGPDNYWLFGEYAEVDGTLTATPRDEFGFYWSGDEYSLTDGYSASVREDENQLHPAEIAGKGLGFFLRCVQDQ